MSTATWIAAGHFIAAFALGAALAMEWALLSGSVGREAITRLRKVDAVYGVSALALLAFGFARVFVFEKGAAYYLHSIPFWIKLGLFVTIGLLSIGPTLAYLRAGKALRDDPSHTLAPARIDALRRSIHWQLALLVPLVVCASLMAKGVGHLG